MAIEVERKWLVYSALNIPEDVKFFEVERIRQAYLINKDKHVIRVRSSDKGATKEATVTVKGPSGGKFADEYEMSIPYSFAEKFMEGVPVIEKTRKKHRFGNNLVLELDFFTSPPTLNGMIIAEIEFDSLDLADYFVEFNWFGEEVTHNPAYSNSNLYKMIGGK